MGASSAAAHLWHGSKADATAEQKCSTRGGAGKAQPGQAHQSLEFRYTSEGGSIFASAVPWPMTCTQKSSAGGMAKEADWVVCAQEKPLQTPSLSCFSWGLGRATCCWLPIPTASPPGRVVVQASCCGWPQLQQRGRTCRRVLMVSKGWPIMTRATPPDTPGRISSTCGAAVAQQAAVLAGLEALVWHEQKRPGN